MSPDELWDKEAKEIRRVSRDALKLFCTRISRDVTIGRNGVRDSELGLTYWSEWMAGIKGTKVYLRRDIKAYQIAWVFRADNHEYLGKADMAELAPALAKTDIAKAKVKELMSAKKRMKKIAKSYIESKDMPEPEEILMNMATGVEAINKLRGYEPRERKEVKVIKLRNTAMDKVVIKEKQMMKEGTYDLSAYQPNARPKKLYTFACEKAFDEKHGL